MADERLDRGLLDFAIIVQSVDLTRYNHLELPSRNRWGLIVPADDPLARRGLITREELVGLPLICSRQGLEEETLRWLGELQDSLDVVATYDMLYNAALMTREGIGYALGFEGIVDTGDDVDEGIGHMNETDNHTNRGGTHLPVVDDRARHHALGHVLCRGPCTRGRGTAADGNGHAAKHAHQSSQAATKASRLAGALVAPRRDVHPHDNRPRPSTPRSPIDDSAAASSKRNRRDAVRKLDGNQTRAPRQSARAPLAPHNIHRRHREAFAASTAGDLFSQAQARPRRLAFKRWGRGMWKQSTRYRFRSYRHVRKR